MTKSEIREECNKLRERISQIDKIILSSEAHIKELKNERFLLRERIGEILSARDDDYNPRLKSVTLVYQEDLDIEKIITEGIGGIKI